MKTSTPTVQGFDVQCVGLVDVDVAGGRYAVTASGPAAGISINLYEQGDNVGVAALTEAKFSNTTTLLVNATYII